MDVISNKLEIAKHLVLEEFGDAVAAIIVIGSITHEKTEASDLDVSVIYYDRFYNERIEDFRDKLSKIADRINREHPRHPIVLWATKEDHYLIGLPDISYVKRNLPYTLNRLDAWGGLAKDTLKSYELASHKTIYPDEYEAFLMGKCKGIPTYEAIELFLIATRTFAEGIVELTSTDPKEQRSGRNHVAKAGLRAAYAALISKKSHPLNSYREIRDAAKLTFPEDLHSVLNYLYQLKTGTNNESQVLTDFLPETLKLLYYCEGQVSTVRRLSMSGVSMARAGESFAFESNHYIEVLKNDPPAQSEDYCRFPGFDVNHIHSSYFLITAFEIVRRFMRAEICDPEILNFFFEEIFVVGTFALYSPFGTKIQIGRIEMIELRITIALEEEIMAVLEEREKLFLYLSSLKQFHESQTQCPNTPWLSNKHRFDALQGLIFGITGVTMVSAGEDILPTTPTPHLNKDTLAFTLRWQSRLLKVFYSEDILKAFNQFALLLYQNGQNDDARAVLQELLYLDYHRDAYPISQEGLCLLSTTRQYLGITYHDSGDTEQAKHEYIKALELNSDNFSALDDLTSLLLLTEPTEASVKLLSELVERSINCRKESQEQVSQRFMFHAIKLKQDGNYSDAETWYTHAIDFDPTLFKAYFNYGLLLGKVGKIEMAAQNYEKAIELNPQYKNAYVNLALLRENQGDAEASITLLNSVIEFELADEQVWTNLGNSYLKVNDLESADKSFVEALKINDNFADAWNGRGFVLISPANPSQQDLSFALVFFMKAIQLDPSFDGAKMNFLQTSSRIKDCVDEG